MKTLRWTTMVFVSIFIVIGMGQAWAACPPLSITSPGTLPAGTKNVAYNNPLQTSGGQPPITFQKISGSLPPGLNLSSTGAISGTPTASGTYSFTVRATDSCAGPGESQQTAQKAFSLTIKIKFVIKPEVLKAVLPKIEMMLDIPLGALKPGTNLYIKGKIQRLPHDLLSPKQLLNIYNNIEPQTPVQHRDKTILGIYINQGVIRKEIEQLQTSSINLEKGTITIEKNVKLAKRTLPLVSYQEIGRAHV